MNHHRFDDVTRSLITRPSRRHLFAGLAGSIFAMSATRFSDVVIAKKKRKRRKKRKKPQKVTFNDFGCVNVGGLCANSGQCCSGICEGKEGRQTCRGHDASTCQSGQDSCLDTTFSCTTTTGEESGNCTVTTGNAAYCAAATAIRCFACNKDADCVPYCGPQAACIACADCVAINGEETACVGPSGTSCTIPK